MATLQVAATLEFLDCCHRSRRGGVIATIVRSGIEAQEVPSGQRVFLDATNQVSTTGLPDTITAIILPHMQAALRSRLSFLLKLDWADVFIEWSGAPQRLVIFGAGHDAVPLSNMAVTLGWDVCVADGRPAYARPDRFPGASEVVTIPASADISNVGVDADTAVVMMTHNYAQDLRLLPQILANSPRHLGLLGPRKRLDRLFGELDLDSSDFDLHSPVGLDIGGDTAESIALSILAEAHAALSGSSGQNLRLRSGPIHEPVPEIEVSRKARTVPQSAVSIPVCQISHA